jgi:hypothetical protein
MDMPIRQELVLEARDGKISGVLTQSSTNYAVEFVSYNGGDFRVYANNKTTGNHEEVAKGFFDLEDAIEKAMQVMGTLAHTAFPGFEPASKEEN